MKLYAFYTPSHQVLKDEWFLPTLKDDYDLQVEKYDQECQLGEYKSAGWTNSMLRKSDLIIRAITENWNDIFLYSDVDTQFFGPSSEILKNLAKRKDMIFQCDSPEGEICAGFFVCRANHRTLKLWQDIRANLKRNKNPNQDDQDVLNYFLLERINGFLKIIQKIVVKLIKHFGKNGRWLTRFQPYFGNPYGIKWAYLPKEFFGGGMLTGKKWEPGMTLEIPADIILHHANWTIGVKNKVEQLKYVRQICNNHY